MEKVIGMWMDNLPIIISFLSLLVALFVASTNYWRSRAKVKVTQLERARSWILKSYDGIHASVVHKSMKPKMESIALVEIIITNNSSLPISILEYQMKGAKPFESLSYINENYQVTPERGGRIHISSPDDPLTYLKPELTLQPYTSKRGYLLFWMDDKESIQPGLHKLTIITSRKNFTSKIEIKEVLESGEANLYKRPEVLPYE